MNLDHQKQLLSNFLDQWGQVELFSTGSQLVNYSGVLYNVDGSSDDPGINGESWKGLLISNGINSPCNVANDTPDGNSHPNFSVGGHMTPNSDGRVEVGADTYLMPLCSWHNSKARDSIPFKLSRTLMLKLSGFMQGELAATFLARLPSEKRHAVVYSGSDKIMSANLSGPEAVAIERGDQPTEILGSRFNDFILMERVENEDNLRYVVRSSSVK